jgi:hypothetical protein
MFGGRRGVVFLENWFKLSTDTVALGSREIETYKRVAKYPNALKAPQERKTEMQLVVNALCFQIEFRIIAGFPLRSWKPIQKTNAGSNSSAMVKGTIFVTSLIFDELPVITLPTLFVNTSYS